MFYTFSVALILLLVGCTSSDVPTTVKTVQQGATVNEPVLNVSTLDKDDQLMAFHEEELSAEYFCDNGTCHNPPKLVCQFQIYSGDLCLIIPNVNVSNSGQYKVVRNGYQDVMKLVLQVEGQYVTVIMWGKTDVSHSCTCNMLGLVVWPSFLHSVSTKLNVTVLTASNNAA